MWKGDDAKYMALHVRVWTARGKAADHPCSRCGDTNQKHQWANLTGNYADINDYEPMCIPCHAAFDKTRRQEVQDLATV